MGAFSSRKKGMKPNYAELILLMEIAFVFMFGVLSLLVTLFVMNVSIAGFVPHSNVKMGIFNPIIHGPFAPAMRDDTDLNIKNMTEAETHGKGDQFSGAPGWTTENGNHTLDSKVTHYLPAGTAIMAVHWTVFTFLVHLVLVLALRKGVDMEESGKCKTWWISQALICETVVFLFCWNSLFGNLYLYTYIFGGIYLIYRIYSIHVIRRFSNDISACST